MTTRIYQPWLRPDTDDKREENVRWLQNLEDSGFGVHRPTTLVIAASDSSQDGKDAADYVCSGANDRSVIQLAIDSLDDASKNGGRIIFLEGSYALGATAITVSGAINAITLEGQDRSNTLFTSTHASRAFLCSGPGHTITFRNLGISAAATAACIESTTAVVEVDGCGLSGFRGYYGNYGIGGQGARIHDNEVSVTGSGCRGIQFVGGAGEYCVNNRIIVSGAGMGIRNQTSGLGFNSQAFIANNIVSQVVLNSGSVGIYLGWDFFDWTYDCTIFNNQVLNCGTGIGIDGGYDVQCVGNHISSCNMGIDVGNGNTDLFRVLIMGNLIYNTLGAVAHIRVRKPSNCDDVAVIFNKFAGATPAYCVTIGAGCTNCAVFYNDTYAGFATAALLDAGTSTRTESTFSLPPLAHKTTHETGGSDALTGSLDANARLGVRKNSAGSTFLRRRVNLIEGTNVTLTVSDDSGSEEVDITIAASGGSGAPTIKVDSSSIGAQSIINFIHGTGITLTGTDTGTEIQVTINAAASTASNGGLLFNYFGFH